MNAQLGIISYALNREPRGTGRYTQELLVALKELGVRPVIFQAGARRDLNNEVALPGAGLLPGLLTLGQPEIAWAARRHNLELVHDPTGTLPLLLTSTRRVATIHDAIPLIFPDASTLLDWLIFNLWLPQAVHHIDAIITVSQQSKSDIVKYLHVKMGKVTAIPEAVNLNYRPFDKAGVQPTLERHGIHFRYILYVGSVEPRKNLLRLLEAYTQLRSRSPGWHLVIVGARNIWKSSPVAEVVEKQGLQDWVHFTGYIPEKDLPALYNGADLFVFPSLYEGFGLPVLEAMACGTPVVTSKISSLPEVAGDAALLVDPYNVNNIADAMQRILSEPSLAWELSTKGLARAAEFSWERTARETIAVYERVLGKSIL